MKIFVGNLSPETSEEDLREAFKRFGDVTSVTVVRNSYTRESRGFGFVEMPSKAQARSAITRLNCRRIKGRRMIVNEARLQPLGIRSGAATRRAEGRF
jgi:RNA recognition motif-containing protein